MDELEERKIAEEHWSFLEKWIRKAFVDGWIHGAKHSWDELTKIADKVHIEELESEERR